MDGERLLYASSNGDRWVLTVDSQTGHPLVRHDPNVASGGKPRLMSVGTFLSSDGRGPEHQALLELIASLAGAPTDTPPLSR